MKMKEHCKAPTPLPAMFNVPTVLFVFIHSNTSLGFFITPLDWVHSLTCIGPHQSFKICLWDIDYSASLIKLIYSEGVQTCNNVECLDRWFCCDEYWVELLFSDMTLLFFRILLLGTRTEICFDGLG